MVYDFPKIYEEEGFMNHLRYLKSADFPSDVEIKKYHLPTIINESCGKVIETGLGLLVLIESAKGDD